MEISETPRRNWKKWKRISKKCSKLNRKTSSKLISVENHFSPGDKIQRSLDEELSNIPMDINSRTPSRASMVNIRWIGRRRWFDRGKLWPTRPSNLQTAHTLAWGR